MQHGFIHLPLSAWGVPPHATIVVHDLLSNERYYWGGERNYVRLDPEAQVAHVLHVHLPAPLPPEPAEPDR
jgi:starch synthase (maltosyl-transferring)